MWNILKAEFQYTAPSLLLAYGIGGLLLTGALVWDAWELHDFMINTMIVFFIFMGIIGGEASGEGRERFEFLLPVSLTRIAWARLLYVFGFQLGMVILWAVLLLARFETEGWAGFWKLVSMNGFTLSVMMILIIYHDLGYYAPKLARRQLAVMLLAAGITVWLAMEWGFKTLWGAGRDLFYSPYGAALFTVAWLGLTALSLSIYLRRKSFLE